MSKSIPISQLQRKQINTNDDPTDIDNINDVLQSLETEYEDHPRRQINSSPGENGFDMDGLDDYEEDFQTSQQMKPEEMIQTWLFQTDDLKNSLIVFAIFIIATKIPLEKIIYKYVSLEHIPLSDIIIKAAIAGVIFFAVRKLLV
jgi:hypothetical protein